MQVELAGRRSHAGAAGPRLVARAASLVDELAAAPLRRRVTFGALAAVGVGVAAGPTAAVAALATVAAGPVLWRELTVARARRRLEHQLPALLELIARQLRAGRSLQQAVETAAAQTPAPLGALLAEVDANVRLGRRPAGAFAEAAAPVQSQVLALVAAAMEINERRGGPLASTLRRCASIVRDRRAIDAELHAITQQGRLSGTVVGCMPVVAALLFPPATVAGGAVPGWVVALLTTLGWLLVAVGLGLIWRLTDPDASSVVAMRSPRGRVSRRVHPGRAVLGRLGAPLPAWLRGDARTSTLLLALDGAPPGIQRLRTVAAERVSAAVAASVFVMVVLGGGLGLVTAPVAAYAGWCGVELPWRRTLARRRRAVDAALPQLCDLLALELGGGANLHAALRRAVPLVDGPLGEMVATAIDAQRFGAPLDEALSSATAQGGSDDLAEVVSTVIEAHRRGGAMVAALDTLAADVRLRRRLSLQAAARTVPVKILFPLVFCVLPAFALLTVMPVALQAVTAFST